MACTRCARTPNSRCVASLKPAVSRIVRLASRRPARDFGIGARPTVFQVHTMVRLAADVASWQTKMSSAAAMVSLPSAAYPLALPRAMAGIASPRIPSPGIRKATSQSAACRLTAGLKNKPRHLALAGVRFVNDDCESLPNSVAISSRMNGNFCTVDTMIFLPCSMNLRRSPEFRRPHPARRRTG